MKSILTRRPSPALVIACIALFVSLGGVSYGVATGFIDSREIKNNQVRSSDLRNNAIRTQDIRNNEVRGFDIRNSSVQGRDVALNTLTGADISEEDLGKVASAATADTALAAGSAGGVTPKAFSYLGEAGSGFVQVLFVGGLKLEASCTTGSGGPFLGVRATSTVSNSELLSVFPGTGVSDGDFDVGETQVLATDVTPLGSASLVYTNPGGHVVTVQASVAEDSNEVRGTTADCGFFGIAQAG